MRTSLHKLTRIKDILDIDGKIIEGSLGNYDAVVSDINIEMDEVFRIVVRYLRKIKKEVVADLEAGKLVKVSSSLGLYSLLIPSETEGKFFFLTPLAENHVSLVDYQDTLATQSINISDELIDTLASFVVIPKKKFNYLLELISETEDIDFDKIVVYEDTDIKNTKKLFFERQYILRDYLSDKERFNKFLKEAVLDGDITKIAMLFDLEIKKEVSGTEEFNLNKKRADNYYINDVLHFLFSEGSANSLEVNSLWVKIKNKLDNYDFSENIIREYCLLVDRERYKDKQQVVRNCIYYINDHIREKISLNDISADLNVNKSYLSSIFNREMGFSIVDYIHSRRISNSKYLLAHTDFSISEISDYVGYFDTSYFIRIFKTLTKTTPLKYRENTLYEGRK